MKKKKENEEPPEKKQEPINIDETAIDNGKSSIDIDGPSFNINEESIDNNGDDDIIIMDEDIISYGNDLPSTSTDIHSTRDIPQFVTKIVQKRDTAKIPSSSTGVSSQSMMRQDDEDKTAQTMRELVTLFRILSRGRFTEITESEAAMAIGNTHTDTTNVITSGSKEEESDSSESEDEWEDMELVDPNDIDTSGNKNIQIHVNKPVKERKADWKGRWLRTEVNRRIRENRETLHKVSFICLISHCRYLIRSSLDEHLIPSLMLTLSPSGYQSLVGQPVSEEDLNKLVKWFAHAFRFSSQSTVSTPTVGYRFGETARLEKLAERKEYESSTDAAVLLFALLHSLEVTVRLCSNLNLHFSWEKNPQIKKKKKFEKKNEKNNQSIKSLEAWVEVWSSTEKKWQSINPLSGKMMKDSEVEGNLIHDIHYVIAVDNEYGIREVSFRFAASFLTPKFRRRRGIDDWIKETLSSSMFRADGSRSRAEDYEWHSRIEDRSIPQTMNELKQHPLYILEKDVKKYEAIYPRDTKPVGEVKKEKVFLRSNVHQLQGSINWVKFGREIKSEEIPYKTVSKRAKVTGQPPDSLPLYGFWQTQPYTVPEIVDGRLPRNEFGNIYLYRKEMCPIGAVHLPFTGMISMSRTLHKDAVPAVVGWQCQGGRNVPILEGAVVLKEDAPLFVAEMKKRVIEETIKAEKKRQSRIWSNWRRLIIGATRLAHLNEKFGSKIKDQPENGI